MAEFWIDFAEVGHRRHHTGLEDFHHHAVFDPGPHRVAGIALGIGDHDFLGIVAKDMAQGKNLRLGTAAARRSIGLVRHKDRFARDLGPRDAIASFDIGNQLFHDLANMLDVEPAAVEGRVRSHRSHHFADGAERPLFDRIRRFHHHRSRPHPQNQTVTTAIERQRCFFDQLVGRRSTARQKARADPFEEIVRGDRVGGYNNHTPAPTSTNPILRQRHSLSAAGTCRIDLGVGATGTDEFGQLRVTHRQHFEQVMAVERVRSSLDFPLKGTNTPIEFTRQTGVGNPSAQALQLGNALATAAIGIEVCHIGGQIVVAGKRRAKDHPGIVAQCIGQHPALGQLGAARRGLVAHNQGNTGIAEGLKAGRDRHFTGDIER